MTQPRQDDPQFKLRVPRDLLMSIAEAATANNRSTNAEIVARLEASGETIRDRFAMAALTGLVQVEWLDLPAAVIAYDVADAMLQERGRQP